MKKTIILAVFVLLLALGAGLFFWLNPGEEIGSPKDFILGENREIINTKSNIKISVPENWKYKIIDENEGSVILHNQNQENISDIIQPINEGCLVEISIIYENLNEEEIKERIKNIHEGVGINNETFYSEELEETKFLVNEFNSDYIGNGITYYTRKNKKVFSFALYFAEKNKNFCLEKLEKIIKDTEFLKQ